ncbi:MAG: FAD-binding oxidoreductase [Clostridiales bacterium]
MTRTADVAIVGGGVNGCSIAYRLAKAGKKVVLCEKGDFAAGATGSCDQMVILQSKNPGIHLKLALDSAELFQTLAQELDYDIEYFRHGGMITIENEMEMDVMTDFVAKQKKIGLEVDIISREEASKRQRGLGEHLLGCTYSAQDGHVNPFKLNMGFAQAAKKAGAELLIDAEVTDFKMAGGKVVGIKTAKGDVDAETVVIAAGAWSPLLGQKLGMTLPIKPRRGQIIVSQPCAPYIVGDILSAQYIVAKYHPETLLNAKSRGIQLGVGLAISQTARGGILIGATREFVDYDVSNTREGIREILKNAARLMPGLKNLNIIRIMGGVRPYTPDGLPLVGYVKGLDGLFMAAGHEGDGIALSAVTGKIVAGLICEGKAYTDVSALDPNRFELFAK